MRSLFLDALTETERSELDRFDDGCRTLFDALDGSPRISAREFRRRLAELDPEFELGQLSEQESGTVLLEVTSSEPAARPRLQRFASLAPTTIRVSTGTGPRSFEEVSASIEQSMGTSLAHARVRAGFSRGHLLDLVVHLAQASGSADERALSAAEAAVYGLLGDQRADDWIGRIDVAPLPRGGPLRLVGATAGVDRTFSLSLLRSAVENAIVGLYDGMRTDPSAADPEEWTLLEAQPGGDGSSAQADLVYASTRLPEMLKCFLEGAPFSSCRFSERGERFAYLKYRHDGDVESRVTERQGLEDALELALGQGALGQVVGNGVGARHSYVDLALGDVADAIRALRDLGQRLDLPRASWILFCDSEWRREWVGIWSDSPAPEQA